MNGKSVSRGRDGRGLAGGGSKFQRGFGGFLMFAVVAGLTAAAGLLTFHRTDAVQADNERVTNEALTSAKAALIAYAVHREDRIRTGQTHPRPGEFPCPDTNGDGVAEPLCNTTASLLGRLPWRTLGLSDPKDGAGETLWYALSPTFREWDSFPITTPTSGRRINSDTRGTLTVRGAGGASVLTDNAVAVIFAPGSPLSGQNRGTSSLLCSLTTLLGVARLCPTNYLEAATGIVGANAAAGPFTVVPRSDTNNDQLVYITTADVIPVLEMRVGNELRSMLVKYREATETSCKCYPWADTWDYSGGIADIGQNRGRFPTEPFPYAWGTNGIPALPAWIGENDWHNLFWYSVSKQNTDGEGAKCRTCSDAVMVTVDSKPVSALVIAPGTPVDGLARLTSSTRRDNVNLYFEDAANRDGANEKQCKDTGEIGGSGGGGSLKGPVTCDQYTMPTAKAHDRDRLFTVGIGGPGVCAPGAKDLVEAAPCGWPTVSPTCKTSLKELDSCTCLDAARVMTRPPCVNSLNPGQCQTAIAKLNACQS